MVREVRWSPRSQHQLEKAYRYILLDSYQNAEKVMTDILTSTRRLAAHPEMYPPDKYRNNNSGNLHVAKIAACAPAG